MLLVSAIVCYLQCLGMEGFATHRRAGLDVKPPHGVPVIHRVERRHLVYPHRWHFQQLGDLVHDADAREAVLPLAEVEEGHHGGFFVLRGVAFEDFGDELLVDFVEFEGDGGIVFWGVAVLRWYCQYQLPLGDWGKRTYDLEGFACHAGGGCEGSALGWRWDTVLAYYASR